MEAPKGEIKFAYEFLGRSGRVRMNVSAGDQVYSDVFNVAEAKGRERFSAKVCERFGALEKDDVDRELERVLIEFPLQRVPEASEEGDEESGSEKLKDEDFLVSLVEDETLARPFHTPGQHDAQAFVTLSIGHTRQTWPVNSRALKFWLLREFKERRGKTPTKRALEEAIFAIEALVMQSENVSDVFIRLALVQGALWIDLGDDSWRALCVTKEGWRIVESTDVPVRFYRRRGMTALPVPVRGGSIQELFNFVNVPGREDQCLLLSCLVAYLRPQGPFPILLVSGEQGSAKSTVCRRIRALVDPSSVPTRRLPRDERDLAIQAKNSWMQNFDNISVLSPAMSDALCSLSTGGGLGTRMLFTDDEEALFSASRPIALNGIPDLATRPDLLDRAVALHLPRIPDIERKDEETQEAEFRLALPRIFGALLDAISKALLRHPDVRPPSVPRMADFARFGIAAEQGLGFPEGFFLHAYRSNRSDQIEAALEASPLTACVIELMRSLSVWEGPAEKLLSELDRIRAARDRQGPARSWPLKAEQLTGDLRRLAPLLRARGLALETGLRRAGGNRERFLRITKVDEDPSPSVPPSPEPSPDKPEEGVGSNGKDVDTGEPMAGPVTTPAVETPVEREVRSPESASMRPLRVVANEMFDAREVHDA